MYISLLISIECHISNLDKLTIKIYLTEKANQPAKNYKSTRKQQFKLEVIT